MIDRERMIQRFAEMTKIDAPSYRKESWQII